MTLEIGGSAIFTCSSSPTMKLAFLGDSFALWLSLKLDLLDSETGCGSGSRYVSRGSVNLVCLNTRNEDYE